MIRGFLNRLALAVVVAAGLAGSVSVAFAQNVVVHGNRRVDADTVRSYFTDDQTDVNRGRRGTLKRPVSSRASARRREGGTIVVDVVGEQRHQPRRIRGQQQGQDRKPASRGPDPFAQRLQPAAIVDADMQRIQEIYRRSGRAASSVNYRIVDLPNGRIDVVFTIDEGGKTGVKAINFVGNDAIPLSAARSDADDGDEPSVVLQDQRRLRSRQDRRRLSRSGAII